MAEINAEALRAERAQLAARIAEIDAALSAIGGEAVHIMTFQGRIWRKAMGITTDPSRTDLIVVYADKELTTLASNTGSDGWVSAKDWAYIQANPDQFGRLEICG